MIQEHVPTCSPYVVAFNGPPRVGKDTIADALSEMVDLYWDIPLHALWFATPMREAAMNIFNVQTYAEYNEKKDVPHPVLGMTLRQYMIGLSEEFMKPRMGRDIWGRIVHNNASGWWGKIPSVVLFKDLGFQEESDYIESQVADGHYVIVQLTREGTDWGEDSRGYVTPSSPHSLLMRFQNDTTPRFTATEIFGALIQRARWPFPSF